MSAKFMNNHLFFELMKDFANSVFNAEIAAISNFKYKKLYSLGSIEPMDFSKCRDCQTNCVNTCYGDPDCYKNCVQENCTYVCG